MPTSARDWSALERQSQQGLTFESHHEGSEIHNRTGVVGEPLPAALASRMGVGSSTSCSTPIQFPKIVKAVGDLD